MLLPNSLSFLVLITRMPLIVITIFILASCGGGGGSNPPPGGGNPGGGNPPPEQEPCNGEIYIQTEQGISDYAHCTNIDGTIIFAGNSFDKINGFENLISISGNIEIARKDGLDSISGFNALKNIGGSLIIYENPQLVSINAFANLESIGESFYFFDNPQLQSISTFSALYSVEGFFGFSNLPRIGSIDQFPSLEVVNGAVAISNNGFDDETGRIFSLHQLGYCPLGIEIEDEVSLADARYCIRVRGDLVVSGASLSGELGAFPRLKQIDGSFLVRNTANLTGPGEFPALEYIGFNFVLQNNISLENGGIFSELMTLEGRISITNNPELIHLPKFESLTTINFGLTVENNFNLLDMTGLEQLDSIYGALSIDSNFSLQTLSGLNALQIIEGEMTIEALGSLENMNGLDSLASVGELTISNNPSLINLAGLDSLKYFGNKLTINNNASLQLLNTFTQLDSTASSVNISQNDKLTSLVGLENINVLEGLHISSNDMLTSLMGLDNVIVITGALTIIGNDSLENFNGLSSLTTVGESVNLDASSVLAPELIADFRQALGIDCNMDDCRIYPINHSSGSSLPLRGRSRAIANEPFALFLNQNANWALQSADESCDDSFNATDTELFLVNIECTGEYLLTVSTSEETIEQSIFVLDPLPTVAFNGVPETLNENDILSIQISILNPEQGSYTLHSASGPPGVSLDPTNSTLSWSKANDIFSINQNATLNFGVYAGEDPRSQFEFTTKLFLNTTPTLDYFPFEESITSSASVGGIELQPGSTEGDVVYFSGSSLYKYDKTSGTVSRTPGGLAGGKIDPESINYFDVSGDGIPEVGYIYKMQTGISNQWQAKLYVYNFVTESAIVDEVLVEYYSSSIIEAEAINVTPYSLNGELNYAVAFAGSFRGEGAQSIIQPSGLYNYNAVTETYDSLVNLSQDLTQAGFNISDFKIEDLDNDSNPEFYVVGYNHTSNKQIYKYEFSAGSLQLSGSLGFIVPGSSDTLAGFYFSDTNNDGLKEIIWLGGGGLCNEANEGSVVRVIDNELNIIKQKYEKFAFGNYTALPKISNDNMSIYANARICSSGEVGLAYYDVKNQALVWLAQHPDVSDPAQRVLVATNSATEFTNTNGNRSLFIGGRFGVSIITP